MNNTSRNRWSLLVVLVLSVVFVAACEDPTSSERNGGTDDDSSDDAEQTYDITVVNETDFSLTIDSNLDRFERFSVASGETKTIQATSTTVFFDISGDTGEYTVSYDRDGTAYTLIQYEYYLEYEISGTTSSVSVTLNNPSGNTEQFDPVSVPHTYSYKTFPDSFYYISAQNNESSGSVTVSIYRRGKLIETATSSGAYVIASASANN